MDSQTPLDNEHALSPTGRYLVLAVVFSGLVCAGFQLGLMPLAALSIARDLMGDSYGAGVAGEWFAWHTAALMLGAAFGGILLGALGDRVGRTTALGISIVSYSLFGGAGAWVASQEQLLLLRFLTGLGVGGVWPNGVALVAECWRSSSRPLVAGVAGAGINVGILCVSQLGRLGEVTPDSWRWLMYVGFAPVTLGGVALSIVPESPTWRARRGSGQAIPQQDTTAALFRPPLLRLTLIGIALGSIPLVGAWAASKWMIPWADQIGGAAQPGYKALTQGYWAVGAILGSFFGSQVANLLGRRVTYFLISLFTTVLTCGIFLWSAPLRPEFLPLVFLQGAVATLFFGWLPLYLPELFPTAVRAAGTGIAYNFGRFASAAGVLGAGVLMSWSGGDYAKVGVLTGLVYAVGMIVVWWAPETSSRNLDG